MRRVDPRLTTYARTLRNASTKAERMLWLRLRQYRPRFTRQLVVGPYIVDLACREARVAIELDGGQHAEVTADYTGAGLRSSRSADGPWSGCGTMR